MSGEGRIRVYTKDTMLALLGGLYGKASVGQRGKVRVKKEERGNVDGGL
jgi:hypothetical protein